MSRFAYYPPILAYHRVGEFKGDHVPTVSTRTFERHLAFLARGRYRVVGLEEVITSLSRGQQPARRSVAITFDDGFGNNFQNALPLLKKYGYPATVFVVTDRIGTTDAKRGLEYMSADEIKEMEASELIAIEPHTMSHPKLAALAAAAARNEIEGSRTHIESLLGKRAALFAYPYGNFSHETARIVSECGYDAAVTVEEGTVGPDAPLYRLPRNSIDASTTLAQFKGKISTAIDSLQAVKIWK